MEFTGSISHDWQDKTTEAKARWFQSLSLTERMDIFCELTDLILEVNPSILEKKIAQPIPGRIQVLEISELKDAEQSPSGN